MHPSLNIAISAARAAGDHILKYYERRHILQIHEKSKNDFCSEVDLAAEQLIIQMLSKAFPEHGFMAEESGLHQEKSDYIWVIDPLDGTTNYLHGYPFFCVSIGLKINERVECGVVYDPLKQECFSAARGEGARLNDRRLRINQNPPELAAALVGTTVAYTHDVPKAFQPSYESLVTQAGNIRKSGAAALELAYVAANRLDAFIGFELKPWDIIAGALLIKEAGGFVADFSEQQDYLHSGNVICAATKLFKNIVQVSRTVA